jgi:hypothetical protein
MPILFGRENGDSAHKAPVKDNWHLAARVTETRDSIFDLVSM